MLQIIRKEQENIKKEIRINNKNGLNDDQIEMTKISMKELKTMIDSGDDKLYDAKLEIQASTQL